MLKVLMTADTIGGVWTYALQLIAATAPYNVEYVLCSTGELPSSAQRDEVARLSNVRLLESSGKLEWMEEPWDDLQRCQQWLQQIARNERPDVVHLNEFVHASGRWDAPVLVVGHSCVLSWHEAVRRSPAGSHWARYRRRVAAGLRAADAVVAPSQTMLNALHLHYGPLECGRVIYNGLTIGDAANPDAKEPFVLTAGRLWDEGKNVATVVRAADRIGCPVRLAGDTGGGDGNQHAAANIQYLGRLPAEELYQHYRKAAVYALPARYEPFGYTPLEAALHGCALVLGDIPSLREIWRDAAVYVPPDDDVALAESTNDLLGSPAKRRRYSEAARRRATALTATAMATRYVTLYRRLIAVAPSGKRASESCVV